VQSGFVEEGRKRNARFLDGEYDDFIIMSLLRNTEQRDAADSR
jgi:RimJ/RimL family protein N-acetyltransferase